MHTCDIVYFLREGANEELRYSLRSVMKNFPHRDIWFYGGKPDWLKTDKYVYVNQWKNKWGNVQMMLKEVCENENISENFFIFNDDFFIMKPVKQYRNSYDGDFFRYLFLLERQFGINGSTYINRLRKMANALLDYDINIDIKNYATHTPFLVNKQDMKETLERFPDIIMYRCLYGNYKQIGGVNKRDMKYNRHDTLKITSSIVSTSDVAFKNKNIGKLIREQFKEKSIFERN